MEGNAVVHLIDDDEGVRQALAFSLSAAGLAVRVYPSAVAFLDALETVQPGCILTDVRMPEVDGIELLRRLGDMDMGLPVIVMTGHADVPMAVDAMKAGAVDFIEKPFDEEVLLSSIRSALKRLGESDGRQAEIDEIETKLETLSARERQVLDGLLAGYPNKTIAYDLNISPRTVEVHRANVMTKMGAGSLSDLVRMALMARALPDRCRTTAKDSG
jgi:two-component system response regulator FixJ